MEEEKVFKTKKQLKDSGVRKIILEDLFLENPSNLKNDFIYKNVEAYSFLDLDRFDNTWASFSEDFTFEQHVERWAGFGYKFIDNKHTFLSIPPENIKPDKATWEVEYRYNKNWFRCDEFRKEHGRFTGKHIVFTGCSNTEGVGGNIEDTWSHMLYTELNKRNTLSGYYNLGKGGNGWQQTFTNFIKYVNSYGAPEMLVMLMPNVLRNYVWSDELNRWTFEQKHPYSINPSPEHLDKAQPTLDQHQKYFPIFLVAMNMFLNYCKAIGTEVVWSTWDSTEDANIRTSNFFHDSYIPLKGLTQEYIEEKRPGLKLNKDDLSFRDGHPGVLSQTLWYEMFLDELTLNRGL